MLMAFQMLSRFMKKGKEEFITACDGLEAFEKYQGSPESFKVIFMGMFHTTIITSSAHIS
jgi:hypothetical protein